MRLLILTQKIDLNDDVLGFFHNWIKQFSFDYEKITALGLEVGQYDLPDNVKVLSLGKEKKLNRLQYTWRLYKYAWQARKKYDAVFVHMNVEYIILAGLLWKLLNKKIVLWYNHKIGGFKANLAMKLSNKILHTSPFAYSAKFKKAVKMPVGIDTEQFKYLENQTNKQNQILSIGRVSPVKNIHILIETFKLLDQENFDFTLNIYGNAPIRDKEYFSEIKDNAKHLIQTKKIIFHSSLANYKTPEIYSQNNLFINLTPSGSFDKTILEAMACQKLVLICNQSFGDDLSKQFLFKENDVHDLKNKIKEILSLDKETSNQYSKKFRDYVIDQHSLKLLSKKLKEILINL